VVELFHWVSLFNRFYFLLVAIAQTECDIESLLSPAPDSFKVKYTNLVAADCSYSKIFLAVLSSFSFLAHHFKETGSKGYV